MAYLQYGSGDTEEVRKLQQRLMDQGYDIGSAKPDGDFGTFTQNALRSYQADQGLNSTGVVDESTYEALYGTGKDVSSPEVTRTTQTTAAQQPTQTSPTTNTTTPAQTPGTQAPASTGAASEAASIIQQYLSGQVKPADTSTQKGYLDQGLKDAQAQQTASIDYATEKAVTDLARAAQDAAAQYQAQRDQVAADEAKAKDNQALYAERRGDKGGIGAAQYDAIMANAAKNRLAVSQAQTKLATDTARQIADLRAQGAYEKANALLSLSQQYLSQLVSLEQWAAEFGLSVEQFRTSLDEWQKEFALKESDITGIYNGQQTLESKRYQQNQLAEIGQMLLQSAVMPSPAQLQAMGMTEGEAQSIINAVKLGGEVGGNGMSLSVAKEMADAGIFSDESLKVLKGAGYTDEYLRDYYGYGAADNAPSWVADLVSRGYENAADMTIWNEHKIIDGEVCFRVSGFSKQWLTRAEIDEAIRSGQLDVVPNPRNNTITFMEAVTE